jgi:hemolysin-activating ACP:hemolysin acyltransferase
MRGDGGHGEWETGPRRGRIWASVSDEVDKRLSENLNIAIKLRPHEWRSGDVLWLIAVVGDPKAIPHLLRQVQETAFKTRDVKMRTLDAKARPVVRLLNSTELPNGARASRAT